MEPGAGTAAFRKVGNISVRTNESARDILKANQQPPKSKYIPQGAEMDRISKALKRGFPIIIEGPSGNGKTTLLENVAAANGALLSTQMCSEGVDEAQIKGFQKFNSENSYLYQDGSLTLAARASNVAPVIYYLDEVNMLRKDIRSTFHSLLDHRKSFTYDILEDGNIVKPENFSVVMSYNPDRRNALEDSWFTRCTVIRLGYPRADVEQQILLEVGGLKGISKGANIAEGLVKFANALRKAKGYSVKNGDAGLASDAPLAPEEQGELTLVREAPSTRLLVNTCDLIVNAGEKFDNYMQNIYDNLLAGTNNTEKLQDALVKLAEAFLPHSRR